MPDRRMIHRKAATSSDLADLREKHGPDAALFFVLLIPFYDRYGCVPDDPRTLRGLVCSMWDDVTTADVRAWVGWLVKRGTLVRVTGPSGARGLRNPRFAEHQSGAKLEREAPSPYEPTTTPPGLNRPERKAPNSRKVRTKSGAGPEQVRTSVGQGRKGVSNETPPSPFPLPADPPVDSAAASAEASAGPQPQPPDVEGAGRRVDFDDLASQSPTLRAALAQARARRAAS